MYFSVHHRKKEFNWRLRRVCFIDILGESDSNETSGDDDEDDDDDENDDDEENKGISNLIGNLSFLELRPVSFNLSFLHRKAQSPIVNSNHRDLFLESPETFRVTKVSLYLQ